MKELEKGPCQVVVTHGGGLNTPAPPWRSQGNLTNEEVWVLTALITNYLLKCDERKKP